MHLFNFLFEGDKFSCEGENKKKIAKCTAIFVDNPLTKCGACD